MKMCFMCLGLKKDNEVKMIYKDNKYIHICTPCLESIKAVGIKGTNLEILTHAGTIKKYPLALAGL